MTSHDDTRSHDIEIEIDAPVEAVWKALTDAEELTRWVALDARVTPGQGGSIWLSWGVDAEGEIPIEIWEPNRHLRQGPEPQTVDYYLEGRGGGTVLRLVHAGFGAGADSDAEYEATRTGWALFLRNLRHYLERHPGKPGTVTVVSRPTNLPVDDAWRRLMSPAGLLAQGTLDAPKAGDRYAIQTSTGDALAGIVQLFDPPLLFGATLEHLDDALLGISFNYGGGPPSAAVELRAYGVAPDRVDAERARWEALLQRVYPSA